MSTWEKTLNYCQTNGQIPPLLTNCNNFIIQWSKYQTRLTKLKSMHCEQRANYVLDPHLPLTESMLYGPQAHLERRSKPRSTGALPARVWGVDRNDHPFSFDCLLDNISASGLYLRLPRRMKFSAVLSLVVRLTHGPFQGMSAAIKGTVIRQGRELDGHTGIAIRIVEHRFI
jgi:hypothetical protein